MLHLQSYTCSLNISMVLIWPLVIIKIMLILQYIQYNRKSVILIFIRQNTKVQFKYKNLYYVFQTEFDQLSHFFLHHWFLCMITSKMQHAVWKFRIKKIFEEETLWFYYIYIYFLFLYYIYIYIYIYMCVCVCVCLCVNVYILQHLV